MTWSWEVAERDHEIQDPTSAEAVLAPGRCGQAWFRRPRSDGRALPVRRPRAHTGLIAASEDDWDRYESLHWRALEEWLAANPEHADTAAMRARHLAARDDYLRSQRARLGWAIFAGRKS